MKNLGSLVLRPLSALYGAITRTRLTFYNRGTFRTAKLARPVISVGNITTGGTGKTPLVEWISRVLAGNGLNVCILTRGYGRKNSNQRVLVSDGETVFSSPAEAGDEAFLLATRLVGQAAVICDADRIAAGEGAIKHLGVDCFVLDDGFQHLRLDRDLNIVTIDGTNPWGGGHLLPYGRLREPLSGLQRADCMVLTRTDQAQDIETVIDEVNRLSGGRPLFRSRMQSVGVALLSNGSVPMDESRRCFAFCAVANPNSFFNQVRNAGYDLLEEKAFVDHHVYRQSEIDSLLLAATRVGAQCLITTEKDAVKLQSLSFSLPCYILKIEIAIENSSELKRLILEAAKCKTKPTL